MGIEAHFNLDKIFSDLNRKLQPIILEVIAEAFHMACLEVVKKAKTLDTYQDQTNHLRSSIGYQIYQKGELVTEYFETSGSGDGTGSKEGVQAGKELAENAAKRHPEETLGVIVAGADYALAVESKGYDVLSGPASELAEITRKYLQLAVKGLQGGANG